MMDKSGRMVQIPVKELLDEGEIRMNKTFLREMAGETIRITNKGGYELNGKHISLVGNDFSTVRVLSPELLESIEKDEDKFFEREFRGSYWATFFIIDCDSYEAANLGHSDTLVMNFANAIHVGGGFLNGAMAQEECLCRNSTLYASISSPKAREMYDYNKKHINAVDSDYMLLSEDVCVFRDANGNLLDEPFNVSVITIPAPNKNGRAKDVSQDKLDIIMKDRLRKMLFAAARYGYRTLVLGAWGCGAFGHSAKRVAQYYYDLFFGEGLNELFDCVIFAIIRDKEKIEAFVDVFNDKLENVCQDQFDNIDDFDNSDSLYVEANSEFPVCNHDGADEDNMGYTVGLFNDGTPFEAEYWGDGNSYSISVIIPEKKEFISDDRNNIQNDSNIVGFHNWVMSYDNAILCQGMVDEGIEEELIVIQKYVDYLIDIGIVTFCSEVLNGAVFYRIDILGNHLAEIKINLKENGEELAKTKLNFKKFPNTKKRKFEVIKNDGKGKKI